MAFAVLLYQIRHWSFFARCFVRFIFPCSCVCVSRSQSLCCFLQICHRFFLSLLTVYSTRGSISSSSFSSILSKSYFCSLFGSSACLSCFKGVSESISGFFFMFFTWFSLPIEYFLPLMTIISSVAFEYFLPLVRVISLLANFANAPPQIGLQLNHTSVNGVPKTPHCGIR